MAAPSKVFPVIVDADVDADSPGDNTLVEGLRDVGVNLDERIGESGAFPASRTTANHNHDGSNSALISTTRAGASSLWIHSGNEGITSDSNYLKAGFFPDFMIGTFSNAYEMTSSWSVGVNIGTSYTFLTPAVGRATATASDPLVLGGWHNLDIAGGNVFLLQNIVGFIKAVDYTGNGGSQAVGGVGFQPDAVLCMRSAATGTATKNKATLKMAGGQAVSTECRFIVDGAVVSDGVTDLTLPALDGFTVGAALNISAEPYRAVCFKNMTLTNGTAFQVVTYTATSGSPLSVTGVGFRPDLILFINGSSTSSSLRQGYIATRGGSQGGELTSIDVDGFTVPSTSRLNAGTELYSALCLKFAFRD